MSVLSLSRPRWWRAWAAGVLAVQLAALVVLWPARAAAPAPAPIDDASFRALLQNDPGTGHPVDSVQAMLPLLPRALRTNFTLVYDSRSPFKDQITPSAPRVILFTDDGRFILTFIGDPSAPGHDLVETMSFDDDTAQFKLTAYVLPAAKRIGWAPSPAAANCAGCHGAGLRGQGNIPGLAGRSPSYLARQLYDIQAGARAGQAVQVMRGVAARLDERDIIAVAAYLASLEP